MRVEFDRDSASLLIISENREEERALSLLYKEICLQDYALDGIEEVDSRAVSLREGILDVGLSFKSSIW